jgi:L-fuconolactonase
MTRDAGPKRLDHGRQEEILDPDRPIIDTHHHFYDTSSLRYMFDELRSDVEAGHNIVATLYVSTRAMSRIEGPEALRPLGEVEFANGIAAQSASGNYGDTRICAGILGFADLTTGSDTAELLDRYLSAAPDRFRGIRQSALEAPSPDAFRFSLAPSLPTGGVLGAPRLVEGLTELGRRRLTFDTSVFHTQLGELARIADAAPDTTIVLDHMGIAYGAGAGPDARAEIFVEWRQALLELSRRPNVVCKVGGLGMAFWGLGFDERVEPFSSEDLAASWRPYVEAAVEAFGPDRCMLESNYPPDGRSTGYVPLWNAFKRIFSDYSDAERDSLFHGTAARIYRLVHSPAPSSAA